MVSLLFHSYFRIKKVIKHDEIRKVTVEINNFLLRVRVILISILIFYILQVHGKILHYFLVSEVENGCHTEEDAVIVDCSFIIEERVQH